MNHAVFDRIDTDLRPASGETAQDYMERLFSAACADSPGEGASTICSARALSPATPMRGRSRWIIPRRIGRSTANPRSTAA